MIGLVKRDVRDRSIELVQTLRKEDGSKVRIIKVKKSRFSRN